MFVCSVHSLTAGRGREPMEAAPAQPGVSSHGPGLSSAFFCSDNKTSHLFGVHPLPSRCCLGGRSEEAPHLCPNLGGGVLRLSFSWGPGTAGPHVCLEVSTMPSPGVGLPASLIP